MFGVSSTRFEQIACDQHLQSLVCKDPTHVLLNISLGGYCFACAHYGFLLTILAQCHTITSPGSNAGSSSHFCATLVNPRLVREARFTLDASHMCCVAARRLVTSANGTTLSGNSASSRPAIFLGLAPAGRSSQRRDCSAACERTPPASVEAEWMQREA